MTTEDIRLLILPGAFLLILGMLLGSTLAFRFTRREMWELREQLTAQRRRH
ncbi:hypothetical protein [Streptomyces roseochromogenus]|uniref:Uncharacterized protein n=1 Tax=Streptomyces roseochromogenus subsp. oscitans DS 12.976 TaxID=1352936 RepID=V6JLZ2_STRRC|nr:hypothetical protein [Streptomyces roseochromogenus]EST17879.1 hypothetical protein M878_46305 [Streptomyces roseochromogenus subsp. oscitans DS 12.976]EST18155.1 hypothetical protein M878_45630 [Streptomyces roseochromogenus subsp. oscitans DS 12.976]EST36867.1 hypothetical protein M878_00040 [Streptomyces roseochromogenus subsp. oscitans DS 12.976]